MATATPIPAMTTIMAASVPGVSREPRGAAADQEGTAEVARTISRTSGGQTAAVEEGDGDGHSGFAEAIRAWRQRRGWTQEELSHASGLSTRAIRSLERGRTLSPRRTTVQMLADALQVPQTRLMARVRRAAEAEAEPDAEAGEK